MSWPTIGHRIGSSTAAVTIPYGGVEMDSGGVMAMRGSDTMPSFHSRRFMGVDLGLLHRAAEFDTVSWFVPNRGFLDTPLGFEEDVLIAPGTDRGQHAFAARYDAWAGRIWIPARGHIVTTDAWTSGYLGHVRNNHIDRLAISEYHEGRRGFWGGRLMFEQLLEVDPDLRGVTLASIAADPTFSAVPALFRDANRAAFLSFERAVHVAPFGRASMIDAGVFGAGVAALGCPEHHHAELRHRVGWTAAARRLDERARQLDPHRSLVSGADQFADRAPAAAEHQPWPAVRRRTAARRAAAASSG